MESREPTPPPDDGTPRGPDRRVRPTPVLSRYTFLGGRRLRPRRGHEREGAFVDVYSGRLAALLLIFFALTVFDSVATLYYLRKGGTEANPIAQWMIDQGNVEFVVIKGVLTGVCVLFVLMHKNFRYARYAIGVGFSFYFVLAIYHLVLQVHAWKLPPQY
ncbi:MAG: DUF5658 family protein [Planctomycetota bacterium JB042]